MIVISSDQMTKLRLQIFSSLSKRIDIWISQKLPRWKSLSALENEQTLNSIMNEAIEAKMQYETDFALFVYIVFDAKPNWRIFLSREEVRQVLAANDWCSEAKILMLHKLSKYEV